MGIILQGKGKVKEKFAINKYYAEVRRGVFHRIINDVLNELHCFSDLKLCRFANYCNLSILTLYFFYECVILSAENHYCYFQREALSRNLGYTRHRPFPAMDNDEEKISRRRVLLDLSAGEDLITPYKMKKIVSAFLILLLVVVCAGCALPQRLAEIDKEAVKDVIYIVKNPIDVEAEFDSNYDNAEVDISVATRDGGEATYSFDADLVPVKEAIEQIPKEGKYDINIKLGKINMTYQFDIGERTLVRVK